MRKIGIMQGRLTPALGRGIQFFPFEEWREEFIKGKKIGIDEIEWIFDYPNYMKNPLWGAEGRKELYNIIEETGVRVNSICWDYFMRRPFYKYDVQETRAVLAENTEILQNILCAMCDVGATLLEIPMVDGSSVKSREEETQAVDFLRLACDLAADKAIMIGVEADFPPDKFRGFLDEIGRNNIVANYDSGNSSGLGYDHEEELLSLNRYVYNIHIKDRVKGNGTVKLGTGSADFDKVFGTLKKINYQNSVILQAARGADGKEEETICEQIEFVRKFLNKYDLNG